MDERLLVRAYDVGFGDCIYVRIPDKDDAYHVLIDCGGSLPADPTLKEALDDVRAMLPKEQGSGASATPKKRLDLLVVTHPHADHVKGFDPAWFKGIRGCWDVMFKVDEAHGHLSRSLDFLKVGHHGSVNGTPFVDKAGAAQPILDRLLPVGGQAQVVVSTLAGEHGEKKVVPYPDLLEELGRRAANARPYPSDHAQPDVPQPPRTDLESGPVDVLLRAASG